MIKVTIDLSRQEKKIFQKYIEQNHSLQRDKTQRNYTISARVTSAIPNLPGLRRFSIDRGHYQHPLPNVSKRDAAWDNRDLIQSYSIPSSIHRRFMIHNFKQFHVFPKKKLDIPPSSQFSTSGSRLTCPSNLHPRFRIQ